MALEVQIIDQDADTDAAVRGLNQVFDQDLSGGILIPNEILQIQRLLGQLGHCNPRRKRAASVGEDGEPRLVWMTGGCFLEVRPDRGARVIRERDRRCAGIILRHAGAAIEKKTPNARNVHARASA